MKLYTRYDFLGTRNAVSTTLKLKVNAESNAKLPHLETKNLPGKAKNW